MGIVHAVMPRQQFRVGQAVITAPRGRHEYRQHLSGSQRLDSHTGNHGGVHSPRESQYGAGKSALAGVVTDACYTRTEQTFFPPGDGNEAPCVVRLVQIERQYGILKQRCTGSYFSGGRKYTASA